jgi:hypothetical protein
MAAHIPAVVCAWCNRTVMKAVPGAPVTHTICESCADWTFTHQTLQFGGAVMADEDYIDLPPRDVVKVARH